MERAQTSEDAATEPPAVSSLDGVAGRVDFDLENGSVHRLEDTGRWSHVLEVPPHLGRETVRETSEETPATGEDDVA